MFKQRFFRKNLLNLTRSLCSDAKFSNINEATKFFYPLLGIKESTMYKYLAKHSFLMDVDPSDVQRKIAYFKYLNATTEEILKHPHLLSTHLITIENRTTILRECGFVESLNLFTISKYLTIINRNIVALKNNKFIPSDLNMVDQLKKQFDMEIDPQINFNDDMPLQTVRIHFLNAFLRERLKLSESEFEKLWKTYSKIKHKSFGHTQRVIDILEHDLKLSREKLVGNLYLLHADPENLLRYPEVVPSIAGVNIKDIMLKQPKVMMVSCEKVNETLNHFREFGIDEAGLLKYSAVLTLSPDTILARLQQMKNTKEFEIFFKHPRITKLIAYQTKAAIRLDFLQHLKVRCASLNILSSHSHCFEKYVREGYDRTKAKDIAHYLNIIFPRQGSNAMKQLRRHPNWFHVPAVQMQETLDYLKGEGFSLNDIFENIQILLYPLSRITQKLEKLKEFKDNNKRDEELNIELTSVTPSQLLTLCLYIIELDFHFTGDGIWPDQMQHSDSSTTTNIELPRSLNKDYKYGKKPPIVSNIQ